MRKDSEKNWGKIEKYPYLSTCTQLQYFMDIGNQVMFLVAILNEVKTT